VKSWQRKVVYATATLSTAFGLFFFFFIVFQCGKPSNYIHNILTRQCVPYNTNLALSYLQAAVVTSTDFVFAVLPAFLVWNLAADIRTKMSIWLVLSLATMYVVKLFTKAVHR
jgi:hypothetical protein